MLRDAQTGVPSVELATHVMVTESGEDRSKFTDGLRLSNAVLLLRGIANIPSAVTIPELGMKHPWMFPK